jgi:BlaI family transcriptional regulator, penicillinase repressor
MKLSKTEEELMELIWKHKKVFLKELIDCHPDPKPAQTTIATLLKRMQDKGFVGYTVFGNSRQYYPLINKAEYFSNHVKGIIKTYFNNSALQFASFFTTTTDLTTNELEELKKIVNEEIKRKKK